MSCIFLYSATSPTYKHRQNVTQIGVHFLGTSAPNILTLGLIQAQAPHQ